jgi:hypothetical protein
MTNDFKSAFAAVWRPLLAPFHSHTVQVGFTALRRA